jgi:hypothetical protein
MGTPFLYGVIYESQRIGDPVRDGLQALKTLGMFSLVTTTWNYMYVLYD